MTFSEIMLSLSKMYNSYDATCWLSKERVTWKGASAAELIKVERYFFTSRESPGITLKTELLFSLLQLFHFARSGRQLLY